MKKPNIIFITAQNCGRFFGCYGKPNVKTPAIDRFAASGAICTNMFASSSLSSPSKASMMTGRYPQANGMMGECDDDWGWALNDGEVHLAALLKLDGYETVLFRMQQEGDHDCWRKLGYDDFRVRELQISVDAIDPLKAMSAPRVAREVANFLMDKSRRPMSMRIPFFLQVGFYESGKPYSYGNTHPETSAGVSSFPRLVKDEASDEEISGLQGSVNSIDQGVETILQALRRSGMDMNTIVVFATTSGCDLARDRGTLYDAGLEEAMMISWPGKIKPGTVCSSLLSCVDILPTLLDLVETDMPFNLNGFSFASHLKGETAEPVRQIIHAMIEESRCIRTPDAKFIVNFNSIQRPEYPVKLNAPRDAEQVPAFELYCLSNDPDEVCNLYDNPAYAQPRAALRSILVGKMKELNDPLLKTRSDLARRTLQALVNGTPL